MIPHLVINISDVHAVKDVKVEVVGQDTSQNVKWDVGPVTNKILWGLNFLQNYLNTPLRF